MPGGSGRVGEEPIAELRVIAVRVEQGVGQMRVGALDIGDRALQPAVVRLASDVEPPARHRDGDAVDRQLADERVDL